MDQVYDNLYIGDVNDADNPKKHEQNNIKYILNLSGSGPERDTAPGYDIIKNQNYFHAPIADSGDNTDFMMQQVIEIGKTLHEKAVEEDAALLVHCSVGASRSVAVSAGLMSLQNGRRVEENVNRIRKVRVAANPLDSLVSQVNRLVTDIYNQEEG